MTDPTGAPSFADRLRGVSSELRLAPVSSTRLNRAAARLDQLGRRVHGAGWVRDHEIGACLTAAVRELSLARGQPEVERDASVRRALAQIESALAHAGQGLRPEDPA